MRTSSLLNLSLLTLAIMALMGCAASQELAADPDQLSELKSRPYQRADRRAFDGAPPIVPHGSFGADCASCHGEKGVGIEGLGFSPPSPHGETDGMGSARCRQCHVTKETEGTFADSRFLGLEPEPVPGPRHHELAPPMIPHRVFMREDCVACHAGPAARQDIQTAHPERTRCQQCHLEVSDA